MTFMRVFIAECIREYPIIELISLKSGLFQSPIRTHFVESRKRKPGDVILVPHDAIHFSNDMDYLRYLNHLAKQNLIIFSDRGDFPKRPKIQNSVSLRVALNPNEKRRNAIVIPYNVANLKHLQILKLRKDPKISFVGFLPRASFGRFVRTVRTSPFNPILGNGALVRQISISHLKNSNFLETVITRDAYGAVSKTSFDLTAIRSEFITSMENCDFVLAPRGDANQSARFFESLSAGRVPIYPNSRINYPTLLPGMKYPNFPLALPYSIFGTNALDSKMLEYWNTLNTNQDYQKRQLEIRSFFSEHFEFNSYLRQLYRLSCDELLKLSNYTRD